MIASGYTGRDPQEGLAIEAYCKFSLVYLKWLKVFFVLIKKRKKNSMVKLRRKW